MKKKGLYGVFIKFVIVIGVVAYIIMFTETFFLQGVETIVLESGTIEQITAVDGVITRTEDVVTLNTKDNLYPLVSSGERVSKGQVLAALKDETILEVERQIEQLNSNMGDIAIPQSYNSEIKVLDNKLSGIMHQIIKDDEYKAFNKILNYKTNINQCLKNKVYKIAENDSENVEINEYVKKLNEYEKKLKNLQTTIKSTLAGTVVYKLDGYEEILTTEKISNYTVGLLESFNIPKGEVIGNNKFNSFKIVDNLECYITVVLGKDEAKEIYVDQKAKLRFPEINTHLQVTGIIDYISFDHEYAIVTFKINRAIEDILNYRKTKVEIIWDSETGYKVPSNAILTENDIKKVYVYVNRNYIIEKKVNVIKELDQYAIIEAVEGDKLYLYDNVVINASNINKNKLLKD